MMDFDSAKWYAAAGIPVELLRGPIWWHWLLAAYAPDSTAGAILHLNHSKMYRAEGVVITTRGGYLTLTWKLGVTFCSIFSGSGRAKHSCQSDLVDTSSIKKMNELFVWFG